jgi:signal transduction histidine kinase
MVAAEALRLVVDRIADGVLVVDRQGVIQFANPAAAALFGRPVHELVGYSLGFPVVAGESTEIEVLRGGGGQVTVELRTAGVEWQGQPASLASLRDVTDRRCLEQERLGRARAESASRAKSDFLRLMSHELRTPLNAVIGYSELMLEKDAAPLTTEQRAKLARIRASGQHLRELVDEMIDLADAGEGQLAVGHQSAPAIRPANQALDEAREKAREHGVRLSSGCRGDVHATFTGDEQRVRQILGHLLDNAVKFTPRGGSISLECDRTGEPAPGTQLTGSGPWTRWQVTDSGIGIPTEQLASIFEPFMQVDGSHTREQSGSGLGLTIGRSLARLMKGDLTVTSAPGRGSRFTLWLPAE